jgi:hypothetical protein
MRETSRFGKPGSLPPTSSSLTIPGWLEPIGRVLTIAVVIVVGLVLLAIIIGLLYSLAVWLFSKTSTDPEKQNPRPLWLLIVTRLRAMLFSFRRGAVRKVKCYGEAVRLYTALRTWGRRSGLPHFLNETPIEYGLRLRSRFPAFESEIELIVQAFNREVYGEARLSEQQLATTRFAWRNLSSPLHWPSRLKTRFLLK